MGNETSGNEYGRVGYGSPPQHSRFTKGTPGNPKGRPRGSKSIRTYVLEELAKTITVMKDGKLCRLSKGNGIAVNLTNNAIKSVKWAVVKVLEIEAEAWARAIDLSPETISFTLKLEEDD